MRQNGSIQVQDPSASPTFGLSRPPTNPDVPPTLRRNLFGSHLSRRPVAPATNASTERVPDPFVVTASVHQHARPTGTFSLSHQHHTQCAVNMNVHNNPIYEPRLSPARSVSPPKQSAHSYPSTSQSIVAIDPTTGRPALPVIPTLPSRMPEDSDEDPGADPDEHDDSNEPWHQQHPTHTDLQSSSLVGISSHTPRLHDILDTKSDPYSRDYEKIESILHEMQSQQKARARSALPTDLPSQPLDTPDTAVASRTRGKARAATRAQSYDPQPIRARLSHISQHADNKPRIGGVGATLNQEDKDELLGLIMTSLRRRVQDADDNAWMFGDEFTTVHGTSVTGGFSSSRGDEFDS